MSAYPSVPSNVATATTAAGLLANADTVIQRNALGIWAMGGVGNANLLIDGQNRIIAPSVGGQTTQMGNTGTDLFNFVAGIKISNTCQVFSGAGAPGAGLGVNGDMYWRQDGGALTTIYQKRAGAWVGIL